MKFSSITTTLTLTIFTTTALCGGFSESCDLEVGRTTLTGDASILRSYCKRTDGEWGEETKLDLDTCLGNDDGKLVHRENGDFTENDGCTGMYLRSDLPAIVYTASCRDFKGDVRWSEIDLNGIITNRDGVLECDT
ncbi:Cyanovirin-N [Ascobolus immersus RN42]|uniref:Cyanovirin-N n=1 Tax=Ascobolus immersus RN42 TaxID=1160509 RepID=A0A3N4HWB4_ASCIM|nr:Cyanovirin-N [Ascobolus immersus RN42]